MRNYKLLWSLFSSFFKIGLFTFGGGYAMIPLIQNECAERRKWIQHDELMDIIIIAESTPGPIMINMATFVGSSQAGFLGAVLATFGVVLPSFILFIAIVAALKHFIKNRYVQAVLRGITPSIIGIILAMGLYMLVTNIVSFDAAISVDWQAIIITVVLFALSFGYQRIKKKEFSPILLIAISAGLGIVVYAIPF